jgi:F0F1-type ATP synthase epsilon subunit
MKLTITSPEHHQEYTISWLDITTPVGNFVILPGHVPMMVTLQPQQSVLIGLSTGELQEFIAPGGIAHITRTDATLLLPHKP